MVIAFNCRKTKVTMHRFSKWRLFQKTATGVLVVFMGLMVFVTVVAYMRPSGSTRQDMSKIQLQRKDAEIGQQQQPNPSPNNAENLLSH